MLEAERQTVQAMEKRVVVFNQRTVMTEKLFDESLLYALILQKINQTFG